MSPEQIWQAQSRDAPRISLAYIRHRAEELQRHPFTERTGLRMLMSLTFAGYMVYRGFTRYTDRPFTQGLFVLIFATGIYAAIRWLRRAPPKPLIPADAGALDSLRFFRREVERRISNLTRFTWLGVLAGPVLGVITALLLLEGGSLSRHWFFLVVQNGILFPAVILFLCRRRKRFLRKELETLDLLAKP